MKLIVGLGNPGRRYAETRHNVGFRVIGELAGRYGPARSRSRFKGEFAELAFRGNRALLLCPQTYMNRSGASVLAARDFYKLDHGDILVICDDFNLPLAKLRVRAQGSAGGQKGLQDIIRCLGDEQFPRLRIGIGSPPENWDVSDFVLSKFTRKDEPDIALAIVRAADAVEGWVTGGIESCMNQYNAN
ncbi:MAG: aminoacyl-tRNA hydrolase [Pirellulaceae bacterium]